MKPEKSSGSKNGRHINRLWIVFVSRNVWTSRNKLLWLIAKIWWWFHLNKRICMILLSFPWRTSVSSFFPIEGVLPEELVHKEWYNVEQFRKGVKIKKGGQMDNYTKFIHIFHGTSSSKSAKKFCCRVYYLKVV